MAGLSGLNLIYKSAGMHASLLGFCLESLIIDNDMLGQCLRCVRGIEVTDEALSIDTIAEVCMNGPGHYLGNEQTLRLMQTEYFPRRRRPLQPEGMGREGQARSPAEGDRGKEKSAGDAFPPPCAPARRRPVALALRQPDPVAKERHGRIDGDCPGPVRATCLCYVPCPPNVLAAAGVSDLFETAAGRNMPPLTYNASITPCCSIGEMPAPFVLMPPAISISLAPIRPA